MHGLEPMRWNAVKKTAQCAVFRHSGGALQRGADISRSEMESHRSYHVEPNEPKRDTPLLALFRSNTDFEGLRQKAALVGESFSSLGARITLRFSASWENANRGRYSLSRVPPQSPTKAIFWPKMPSGVFGARPHYPARSVSRLRRALRAVSCRGARRSPLQGYHAYRLGGFRYGFFSIA